MKIQFGVLFAAVAAAAALGGCAIHSGGSAVPQPVGAVPMLRGLAGAPIVPDTGPPPCKGQKTSQQYSSVTEKLTIKGGSLCIPAFGGLGGSITYPPANPGTKISLISSMSNYNGKLPSLHSGTPIFYLQLAIAGATTFGKNAPAGGGLTGKVIKAGSTYTAYAQAVVHGFPVNFTPCYAIATKGKYGGVIGGVGALLKGQSVPASTSGVIEIYPGKSANGKCA